MRGRHECATPRTAAPATSSQIAIMSRGLQPSRGQQSRKKERKQETADKKAEKAEKKYSATVATARAVRKPPGRPRAAIQGMLLGASVALLLYLILMPASSSAGISGRGEAVPDRATTAAHADAGFGAPQPDVFKTGRGSPPLAAQGASKTGPNRATSVSARAEAKAAAKEAAAAKKAAAEQARKLAAEEHARKAAAKRTQRAEVEQKRRIEVEKARQAAAAVAAAKARASQQTTPAAEVEKLKATVESAYRPGSEEVLPGDSTTTDSAHVKTPSATTQPSRRRVPRLPPLWGAMKATLNRVLRRSAAATSGGSATKA